MLVTQTFEAFETTLAREAEADSVTITPITKDDGLIAVRLVFTRGSATCERTIGDAEMDQPWEDIALAAKAALDA